MILTVQSRTAFSAGLYDMLNTGNLDPLGEEFISNVTFHPLLPKYFNQHL